MKKITLSHEERINIIKAGMTVYFEPDEIDTVIDMVEPSIDWCNVRKRGEVANIPCAFDIETTSTYVGDEKFAFMYCWMFGIGGYNIIGRTWEQFKEMLNVIKARLGLSTLKRLPVYVHNLSYEFQFIRKFFNWRSVFALDERDVLYAMDDLGFEYRCSYHLTNLSLSNVAKSLKEKSVKKMVGDLDYDVIRTDITELTHKEIGYCLGDIVVVQTLIAERIEKEGNISKIPMTQTGYARRHTKEKCIGSDDKRANAKYQSKIKDMTLTPKTYQMLKDAFGGGYTHASAVYSRELCQDVTSYDFTSSYPAVLCSEKFPIGSPLHVKLKDKDDFDFYMNTCCCFFDVTLEDVEEKAGIPDHYISKSKCFTLEKSECDNGRVVRAEKLSMTITDVDYEIINMCYDYSKITVANFYVMRKGYLPKQFIQSILDLYCDKTILKGVKEQEDFYAYAKQILNSLYGMCVTDIVRDNVVYDTDWSSTPCDIKEAIKQYNESWGRFLYYPWGVWCTAYARRNLWSGIIECGEDYIYSDTDSIKIFNAERHIEYINRYNNQIIEKLENMCSELGIDKSLIRPKTQSGEEKPLGVWDYDGHYEYFKTLGAKRYIWCKSNGLVSLTVSGVNKKLTVPYILDMANTEYEKDNNGECVIKNSYEFRKFADLFDNNLVIDGEHTGKKTLTYIDECRGAYITDYKGNTTYVTAPSFIHMESATYDLSMDDAYLDYIMGLKKVK